MSAEVPFDLQRYLEGMDRRLDKGINLANHRILVVDDKLTKLDKRLVATETTVKWLSRFGYSAISGAGGWLFYSLGRFLLR